jgi:peptidylprolyl isomerase
MKAACILLLWVIVPAAAFVSPAPLSRSSTTSLSAQKSRTEFLHDAAGLGISAAAAAAAGGVSLPAFADETTPSGVSIKVTKSGTGPAPAIGELAAIRFSAYQGETKIDDIFDTPEPYFTRVGSGGLIKGVEEVLPKMRVGDRWVLTIPASVGHQMLCVISCW